jgi:hypothetical protein
MAKIEFPKPLKELLEGSDLQAPVRSFADRVGEILADNKLPFFPDYTDHGVDHINSVLRSEVDLVPKHIWGNSKKDSDPRLLCDADAVVLIGATLLHDIAMLLRPEGFRELVGKDSRFRPLPWFSESHEGYAADGLWHEIWEEYLREARRFSERQLTNIIGEDSARVWKFHELPENTGQWEKNHCLIVGEFIRRHHARLAHEIAIYGFPGLPVSSGEGQFPAMGKQEGHPLRPLADLIGLTARSHGMSLRVSQAYLDVSPLYRKTPRPMGTAVLYPMALLRVADYLQIDRQRAPAVLLQLRNPQSPISVQEWKKHRAVQHIGPANDPRAKMVTVSADLSLSLYLQLRDLLSGLQEEMDHSTAVLDEAYGTRTELGLHQLSLASRRIYSNLQSPAFREGLPYVPEQTGFTADPNLLTLLVEPLYGKHPGVGVRELMQNAVDAVCELEVWCKARGVTTESLDLPEQEGDVLVEFIKRENGTWFLRVRDRGIGMQSDTIQNYFLRAGASFRHSTEWAKDFLDERGQPRVIRAGRFGIGAFAVFLLGASFRLWTRHAGADKSVGHMIEASETSQLVEVRRVPGLPVGTTIEVEVSRESVKLLQLNADEYSDEYFYGIGLGQKIDWFCWDWPKVVKRVIRGPEPEVLSQQYVCPIRRSDLPAEWSVINPESFEAVFWTFELQPSLSCNGICVSKPSDVMDDESEFFWPGEYIQLHPPNIAICDSSANLSLTIQRYELSQKTLPFLDELIRDVYLSFIAYALVCGPISLAEALSLGHSHPLQIEPLSKYPTRSSALSKHMYAHWSFRAPFTEGLLRWCATSEGMVPADPWLYGLLNSESCLLYGELFRDYYYASRHRPPVAKEILELVGTANYSIMPWYGTIVGVDRMPDASGVPELVLDVMVTSGVAALGAATASRVLVSEGHGYCFDSEGERLKPWWEHDVLPAPVAWREVHRQKATRRRFEAQAGVLDAGFSLESMLKTFQTDLDKEEEVLIAFAAEIGVNGVEAPRSTIAEIWNEYLGPHAIPFNPDARKALIEHGSKHPELNCHIKAWEEMKRTGSKWASGSTEG